MKTDEEWARRIQNSKEPWAKLVAAIQIDALEHATGIIMQMRVDDSKEAIARDIQAEIQKLKEWK